MRKLKLFFACLLMAVLSIGQVWATDFTLSSADEVTQDGITVSFAKGEGSNAPAWYNAGLRFYASNTITITCTNNITGVTFNWEKQGNKAFASATANTGSYSHPSAAGEGTWEGEANSITFTIGSSGQLQLNTFSVTVAIGGTTTCATPTFNPESGETFSDDIDVTISAETGATIYYTTDGNDPTTSSNVYSSTLNFTETTTLKAIAVKEGSNNSAVATATYTKIITVPGYAIDFENELVAYVDWEFTNVALRSSTITAHGGTYYAANVNGSGNGVATASITTKAKVANPGVLTFYISKESNNTTGSSWVAQVSENGTDWTDVQTFPAQSMNKGVWNECTAALGEYSNVYVRISYGSSSAIRAIDDIELAMAAEVAKPTFTVAEGTYIGSQDVEIECTTTNAAIYYTLDGTDPSSSSTPYGEAITISATTTLKAIAIKGGASSSIASATYTIVSVEHAGTAEEPYSVADARNAIDANTGVTSIYATGIVSEIVTVFSSQHSNISFNISDDGLTTSEQLQAFRCEGTNAANVAVGDVVVVSGDLTKYNSTYEFAQGCTLVSLTKPAVPTVSLKQSSSIVTALNVEATNVANQVIDIECTNFANDITSVSAKLYGESTCENEITTNAWVTTPTVNDTKTQLTFSVNDNDGDARQVWMKVTATDGVSVAAAVLAISQAKYSIDYATLPFAYDGNGSGELPAGLTVSGTGTYSSSPAIKFDGTGDWLIIKLAERFGTLTFDIKGNSFSGGTFKVQQSANGETYTDVKEYTEFNNETISETINNLASDTRYVRFIYTEKVSGNVALGNIAISGYVAPTKCEVPTFTPEDGESFTETLDVVLESETDGATIYYTLDGSDPTTSSILYENQITLSETTTIKAIAVKEGLDDSDVSTATFTKVLVINSYVIDFETNDLAPYVNWNFVNIAIVSSTDDITAHGGNYYGNTDGKASASITTKTAIATPGNLTFWTSKESGNTTASSWTVDVSEDGSEWTMVESFSATTGSKGEWTERTADLSEYTNVYVRIAYSGSTAIRAIDDISLEMASPVKKPTISGDESFITSTTVTLSCATDGATIYYTIDGSDPKDSNTTGTSFTLTETATVRAIAKFGDDWSAEATQKAFTKIVTKTVAEAIAAIPNEDDVVNNQYVAGIVCTVAPSLLSGGKLTYYISADGSETDRLQIYKGKNLNNTEFANASDLALGDRVIVFGQLKNFNGTPEMNEGNYLVLKEGPTVAAPVFNPDGGGFMGETNVTITCATEGNTIYYTLDGTTPSKSSDVYDADAPIQLNATTIITAVAYVGDDASLVISKTFTLTDPMTVADALTALDSENPINNVAVVGIISTAPTSNPSNGRLTYYISDDGSTTSQLEVFNGYGLNGASFSDKTDLQVGDQVTVFGNMKIFSGSNGDVKEFDAGNRLLAFNRPQVDVTGVELNKESTSIEIGNTETLIAIVNPSNATNKTVSWSSDDEAVATVNTDGKVTAIAEGTATIRATAQGTEFYAECTVTVTEPSPLSEWASVYTSNVEIASNESKKVIISEVEYDAAKTNKGTAATITLPLNTTKIHMHLVAWNGDANSVVTVTGACFNDAIELTLADYANVSGSANYYDLGTDATMYYFSLTPDNAVAADEVITITAASGKRFVLFGVNQEGGLVPVLDHIAISGDMTNKTGYKAGDELDMSGLTVNAYYTLGGEPIQEATDITDDVEWSYDAITAGQTSVDVTATYEGKTDSKTITEIEVIEADPKFIVNPDAEIIFGYVEQNAEISAKMINVQLINIESATISLNGDGASAFSIDKNSLTANGTITITPNTTNVGSYAATLTLHDEAEGVADKEIAVSLTVASKWAIIFTSNVNLSGTGSVESNSKVQINDVQYNAQKVGSSNASGSVTVVVPKGAHTLHFHAAAWNNADATIAISGVTNASESSFSVAKDAGVKNDAVYTLKNNPIDQYYSFSFTAVTENTTITFSRTDSEDKRFVIYGVNQEGGVWEVTGNTDASTLPDNATVIVEADANLTVNEDKPFAQVIVENGATVTLNADVTTPVFRIETAPGQNATSGQVINAQKITAQEVFMDVQLVAGTLDANYWYGIAAPFDVDVNTGIYLTDGTQLINNTHVQVWSFEPGQYANGGRGWKRSTVMERGKAYLIGFDKDAIELMGKSVPNVVRLKANGALDADMTAMETHTYSGVRDYDWNGFANPNLHHVNAVNAVTNIVQVFENGSEGYGFQPYDCGEYSFVVGTALFVKYNEDNEHMLSITNATNSQFQAPARTADERYSFCLQIRKPGSEYFDNQMYVRASETAAATYESNKDMETLNETCNGNARIWTNAYGKRLAVEEAPLVNNQAIYDLTVMTPAAGTYVLRQANEVEGADLYVTYNGAIVWNLSLGDYELDLTRGTTTGYGLLLVVQPNQMPTGVENGELLNGENGVQKILLNGQLYILRDGHLYDAVGKEMK